MGLDPRVRTLPISKLLTRSYVGMCEVPIDVDLELGARGSTAWADQDPIMQTLLWWDDGLGRFLSVADDQGRF